MIKHFLLPGVPGGRDLRMLSIKAAKEIASVPAVSNLTQR
eukprot:CAMPEP_0172356228 /NCGR_PEP_ID=MMETSP1060-20121228/620_1 /TAXON_ID=37318 /ORGANISM="Pseudo-nitzschia pungens, Strain cf. cingulata" /LENGTH=39 /DNA_ID= /DNA_START= /DNA_END= /DNA_ORIENTATION=